MNSRPRFHVDNDLTQAQEVVLSEKESRHALRVLRLKPGELVELFDGAGGHARGIVAQQRGGLLVVSVDRAGVGQGGQERPSGLTLAAAVIKPEAMDLLVQKAVELGVDRILPLLTQRSVVRLPEPRRDAKLRRWQRIALESCKQCGRTRPPDISPIKDFRTLLSGIGEYDLALLPTLAIPGEGLYNTLNSRPAARRLIITGPEGDFTAEEARQAVEQGAIPVSLGALVMRSETAALYAVSAVQFFSREIHDQTAS